MKSFICLVILVLCGVALASQGKWVLQTQTQFKQSSVNSYQFCIPVGVRAKTDKAFISMQVVFEQTFRYMSVDFDFNGKGWDHIENTETNIATFMLNDYHGNTFSNWQNIAIANGTLTGTIKSDKKPIKIIFSLAVNKENEVESVPQATETCKKFYVDHKHVITTADHEPTYRVNTGLMFFTLAAVGSFILTLSCCGCCYLLAKRRACKRACSNDSHDMEGLYPGEVNQIQMELETTKEPAPVQMPQPIYYIAPNVQDSLQTPYWMPPQQQFVPMMQPQYIHYVPAPQNQE